MNDAITLEQTFDEFMALPPARWTDEQLSDALSVALATDDAMSTARLCQAGAYLDPPEGVQRLLNEYKRRHARKGKR